MLLLLLLQVPPAALRLRVTSRAPQRQDLFRMHLLLPVLLLLWLPPLRRLLLLRSRTRLMNLPRRWRSLRSQVALQQRQRQSQRQQQVPCARHKRPRRLKEQRRRPSQLLRSTQSQ